MLCLTLSWLPETELGEQNQISVAYLKWQLLFRLSLMEIHFSFQGTRSHSK